MQNSSTQSNHFGWVDVVRVLGAFLVVTAHVPYKGIGNIWVDSLYFILSRIAVPMFFMASGYLLLAKQEPYADFFRKRAFKVFIPFIAWSVIYMLWGRESFDAPFSLKVAASYVLKIIRGPRANHLWFFYALIGLYLFTPILRVFVAKATVRDLLYFCGMWFLVTPVLTTFQEFTPLKAGFEIYFAAGYTGYFLLGHLIGRLSFSRNQLLGFAAVFLIAWMAAVYAIHHNSLIDFHTQYFESYLSINVVLMSVSAFILLRAVKVSGRFNACLAPLSKASFGIYLLHVIVIDEMVSLQPFSGWMTMGSSVYMMPLLGLFGFTVSFVIIYILQKIPLMRGIVP